MFAHRRQFKRRDGSCLDFGTDHAAPSRQGCRTECHGKEVQQEGVEEGREGHARTEARNTAQRPLRSARSRAASRPLRSASRRRAAPERKSRSAAVGAVAPAAAGNAARSAARKPAAAAVSDGKAAAIAAIRGRLLRCAAMMIEPADVPRNNEVSVFIREFPSVFGFPTILFLHTLGLAMVAGSASPSILDLARRDGGAPLHLLGLARTMWLGFGINLSRVSRCCSRILRKR